MIKITYNQLKNPEFFQIVQRIYRGKMAFRSAKKILDILKELEKELIIADELSAKLREEHMEPSERPGVSKPKEGLEHETAVKEFLETVVEIQKPRITPQELFSIELSPSDVELLEGLIDGE